MARTVFFSFDYDEDLSRLWNVRKSDQFKSLVDSGSFRSRDRWETVRLRSERAIKSWIDEGLKYSGVTVVLIGRYTYKSKWVRYEIEESERLGKGILGVRVHELTDWHGNRGVRGPNPFDYASISKSYRTYNWISDRGDNNFGAWVEQAAIDVGR